MAEDNIKDLAQKFAEKNPTFIRICMENHFVRFEIIEISQGKITKYEVSKLQSKEVR